MLCRSFNEILKGLTGSAYGTNNKEVRVWFFFHAVGVNSICFHFSQHARASHRTLQQKENRRACRQRDLTKVGPAAKTSNLEFSPTRKTETFQSALFSKGGWEDKRSSRRPCFEKSADVEFQTLRDGAQRLSNMLAGIMFPDYFSYQRIA